MNHLVFLSYYIGRGYEGEKFSKKGGSALARPAGYATLGCLISSWLVTNKNKEKNIAGKGNVSLQMIVPDNTNQT